MGLSERANTAAYYISALPPEVFSDTEYTWMVIRWKTSWRVWRPRGPQEQFNDEELIELARSLGWLDPRQIAFECYPVDENTPKDQAIWGWDGDSWNQVSWDSSRETWRISNESEYDTFTGISYWCHEIPGPQK